MYELLDAAGATLCDPLLVILLAVLMMPSGGSSYAFSGKTDDVGFLLLKARAAARKIPCAHRRATRQSRSTGLAANRRQAQAQIAIVGRGASHPGPLYLICRSPRVLTGFPISAPDGGPFCPLPAVGVREHLRSRPGGCFQATKWASKCISLLSVGVSS